jgi:lysophospholipase L1-like esterase
MRLLSCLISLIAALLATSAPTQAREACDRLPAPPPPLIAAAPFVPPKVFHAERTSGTLTPEIIFVGDSLTESYKASASAHAYPELVSSSLGGRRIDVLYMSGQTSSRIAGAYQQLPPSPEAIVVFWVGRNNPYDDPSAIVGDVGQMMSHSKSAKILVLGILYGRDENQQYDRRGFERISAINKTLRREFPASFVEVGDDLMCGDWSDNRHPNDAGYAKIAATVATAIRKRDW